MLVWQHELDVVHDVYKRKLGRDGVAYGEIVSQKVQRESSMQAIEQIKKEVCLSVLSNAFFTFRYSAPVIIQV